MKKSSCFFVAVLLLITCLIVGCRTQKKPSSDPTDIADIIVIDSNYTADFVADTIEERYANAYYMSVEKINTFYECDPEIIVSTSSEGITFTSTVTEETPPGDERNKFVRIAYKNKAGLFDLTALKGISGEIGIDLYADVDLTNTTNGFYVKLKSGGIGVGNGVRVDSKEGFVPDTILHTSINNSANNVYIELTIPWQGSVTIKGIYLYMETEVTGFAGMAERITGGTGAAPENTYTVTDATGFHNALTAVKDTTGPSIIYVNGEITYDAYWAAVAETPSKKRNIELGANTENLSIIGVGTGGIFDNIGFKISGKNTIIQNLTIRNVLQIDGIEINNAKYTLVDHCTLHSEPLSQNSNKDKYDELISIKNNAEFVILSWNEIYDHYKTILVGSNDKEDALPDRKLIMHHNYIHDCGSRLPLYRGGHAHIYNNYYEDNTTGSGINCRTGSKLLIENNYFKNCKDPIGFWYDDGGISGLWDVNNNEFNGCWGNQPTSSACTLRFESNYSYDLDPVINVPDIVKTGAGTGKI